MLDSTLADLLLLFTITLATTGADGEPHAAPVYFASDEELNLYFFSDPDSRHSLDIAHDSRAAGSIYPECQGWQDIRGIQLRGVVNLVDAGPAWESAWQRYAAKFPFVSDFRLVVAVNQLYVFVPHWVRILDNRHGYGFKEEWVRSAGGKSGDSAVDWWRLTAESKSAGGPGV